MSCHNGELENGQYNTIFFYLKERDPEENQDIYRLLSLMPLLGEKMVETVVKDMIIRHIKEQSSAETELPCFLQG